jgi:xanthine dehydrogenase YagS FAD-binding subunit
VRAVDYERADGVGNALALGTEPEATFYAGGTTLIDLMKLDVLTPRRLVDINHLPLAAIESHDGQLRLGALARLSDTADHPAVKAGCPAISEALDASASAQIRNMATLGGNLLQRTRCAYFRDVATPCNKRDPGSGCGALQGINAEHAVLGTSDRCIAVHASDVAVALVAFDAVVRVEGRLGSRAIQAVDFFLLPGETPELETPLNHGDLITGIEVPLAPAAANSTYLKVRDRTSFAFALASCAAGMECRDGSIVDVRIALGGVGTIPWRARESEDLLRGKSPDAALYAEAARAAFTGARPTLHNAYKIDLGVAAVVRALEAVTP